VVSECYFKVKEVDVLKATKPMVKGEWFMINGSMFKISKLL